MSAALNNVQTGDRYTTANTLTVPGGRRLTIHARATPNVPGSGAIYYQLGHGYPAVRWDLDEVFMPPGTFSGDRRFDAVRVRSGAAGKPSSVTVDAGPAGG